jgi:hypothetical protein
MATAPLCLTAASAWCYWQAAWENGWGCVTPLRSCPCRRLPCAWQRHPSLIILFGRCCCPVACVGLTLCAWPISLRYRPPPIPQASIPKQYLELRGQPIATYSMQMFAAMPQVLCGVAAICSCLPWELKLTNAQSIARRLPAALLSNAL